MGFQFLAAFASTGLSIVGSLDTADYRSRVLSEFSELRNYLYSINLKIDTLLEQNRRLMERLDKLPEQIYQITDEVVGAHLLTERYVNMRASYTLFTAPNDLNEWERHYDGWESFNKDLHYLFLQEYRLSYLPKLIPISELAISMYGAFAEPVIAILVKEKLEKLNTLKNTMNNKIVGKLNGLLTLLDNESFVAGHNLSHQLSAFEDLEYNLKGHQTRVESYTERVCEVLNPECCRRRTVCRNVVRQRTVPDHDYNHRHDRHKSDIETLIDGIGEEIKMYSDLRQVVDMVEKYQASLNAESLLDGHETGTVELVSFGAEELLEKSEEAKSGNVLIKRRLDCY